MKRAAKAIMVRDVIEQLKKFPPDTEVWSMWDEGGDYSPQTRLPRLVDIYWTRRINPAWRENGYWGRKSKKLRRICRLS